jgi:hypothetical protein
MPIQWAFYLHLLDTSSRKVSRTRERLRTRNPVSECFLRDPEPRVEPRRLAPIKGEDFGHAGVGRDHRPRRLHAGAQVAELARRGALVRLPRVVGKAARNVAEGERTRNGRVLVLLRVRVREGQAGLRLRPGAIVQRGAGRRGSRGIGWPQPQAHFRGKRLPRRPSGGWRSGRRSAWAAPFWVRGCSASLVPRKSGNVGCETFGATDTTMDDCPTRTLTVVVWRGCRGRTRPRRGIHCSSL